MTHSTVQEPSSPPDQGASAPDGRTVDVRTAMLARDLGPLCIGCHGTHTTAANNAKRPLWAMNNRMREMLVHARRSVGGAIELVHGPANVDTAPDELVVLTLVRDGEMWVQPFVEHYLELGVKHVFFLDNGSTDGTIARASALDHVTVYRTDLSFKYFEVALRRWITRTLGRGRWSLAPDADELWDYPYSDRLPLSGFLRYLDTHGYKAVVAHALDMFSDVPFSRLESTPDDDLKRKYPYYDLSDIRHTREVYWARNGQLESDDVFCTFGGVRERFFGTECLCQTRHALHRTDAESDPYRYDGHFTAGARIADVTTVLLHYKFIGTLMRQARTNLELGQHHGGSENYRGFVDVLDRDPDLSLVTEHAARFTSVNELVEGGLLTVSPQYLRWVEEHGRTSRG